MLASFRPIRRAFSLVEMLTVIGILAIVIAIVIPAVAGARRAARNTDTRAMLAQVNTAVSMFQTTERRLPGYFTARQMGTPENAMTYGFTGIENLMLDLVGGTTTTARDGTNIITVGPGMDPKLQVNIDLAAMGGSKQAPSGTVSRGYFTMDAKRFVVQNRTGNRLAGNDNALLPVLVDSFGSPVLAWIQDETPSAGDFAADNTTTAGANPARFYWAANAGFLKATQLGTIKEDQTFRFAQRTGSILGEANTPANRVRIMEALLGNPAAPDPAAPAATPKPLTPRGQIVVHSAGNDGVYLGLGDKGAKSGVIGYAPNQDTFGGALFDDIIQAAGH